MQASWASMFLLAGVACGACSSSDDAAGETDAGLQPGDGASDGDGSVGCAMPLSDFCATKPGLCVIMDWPSDVTAFCSVVLSTFDKGGVSMKCGPYSRFANNGVDSGLSYYYDEASGKLLAVVHHQYVFETATCVGGPADFVEPMVCDTHDQLECPDGGDGGDGSPGDSGTD